MAFWFILEFEINPRIIGAAFSAFLSLYEHEKFLLHEILTNRRKAICKKQSQIC